MLVRDVVEGRATGGGRRGGRARGLRGRGGGGLLVGREHRWKKGRWPWCIENGKEEEKRREGESGEVGWRLDAGWRKREREGSRREMNRFPRNGGHSEDEEITRS